MAQFQKPRRRKKKVPFSKERTHDESADGKTGAILVIETTLIKPSRHPGNKHYHGEASGSVCADEHAVGCKKLTESSTSRGKKHESHGHDAYGAVHAILNKLPQANDSNRSTVEFYATSNGDPLDDDEIAGVNRAYFSASFNKDGRFYELTGTVDKDSSGEYRAIGELSELSMTEEWWEDMAEEGT